MAVCRLQISPTAAEYIEYDTEVLAHGVLERSIVMDAGKKLVVYTSPTHVSAVVSRIETAA